MNLMKHSVFYFLLYFLFILDIVAILGVGEKLFIFPQVEIFLAIQL